MLLTIPQRTQITLIVLTVLFITAGCKYDKEELLYPGNNNNSCLTVPSSFNANVLPLVSAKCAIPACHDATAQGGRIFQNYNQVSGAKDFINTRVVVQKTMPPTGPLSPAEINILKCWIEAGALNN